MYLRSCRDPRYLSKNWACFHAKTKRTSLSQSSPNPLHLHVWSSISAFILDFSFIRLGRNRCFALFHSCQAFYCKETFREHEKYLDRNLYWCSVSQTRQIQITSEQTQLFPTHSNLLPATLINLGLKRKYLSQDIPYLKAGQSFSFLLKALSWFILRCIDSCHFLYKATKLLRRF